jgi:hypothetical protein
VAGRDIGEHPYQADIESKGERLKCHGQNSGPLHMAAQVQKQTNGP